MDSKKLSDGRVVFIGPDVQKIPKWINSLKPEKSILLRAGGTTYRWSAWISARAKYCAVKNGNLVGRFSTKEECLNYIYTKKRVFNEELSIKID